MAELPNLQELRARSTEIGTGFFDDCPAHQNLEVLELTNSGIRPPTMGQLKGADWPSLEELDISRNKLVGDKFGLLQQLPPQLRKLNLKETSITNETILTIVKQSPKHLTSLNLDDCPVDNEGLAILAKSPPPLLDSIYLRGTNCTEEAILKFISKVPTLKTILLPKTVSYETKKMWKKRFPDLSIY